MFELFVQDSVVFLIGIVVSIWVLWRRTRSWPGLRPFGLLYIAGTHSSYNILVKPINDFNLVVPRTFLTHAKVSGPLSVLDALMVLLLIVAIVQALSAGRQSISIPREFRLVFFKDVFLAAISLFLFVMLSGQTGSPLGGELMWYRQLLYYIMLFYFADRSLRRHVELDLIQVFLTFMWIDVINLLCGFISTLIYGDIVWQRYFLNVTIIDQENPMLAIMYPLVLIYMWIRRSAFDIPRTAVIACVLITVLLIANFYKGSIAYILLFLPFTVLYAVFHRRNSFRPLAASLAILPMGALFYWIFFVAFSAAPLQTRGSQFIDLTTSMSSLGGVYPIVGIGNGTLYTRNFTDDDQGEVKAIDLEEIGDKASIMQSPGAQIYKATGLPGLAVHAIVLLLAGAALVKKAITDHPVAVASGYIILMQFALNFTFLDPTGMVAFLVVKLFIFMVLARRAKNAQRKELAT